MSNDVDQLIDLYAERYLLLEELEHPWPSRPSRPDVCWYDDEDANIGWPEAVKRCEEAAL